MDCKDCVYSATRLDSGVVWCFERGPAMAETARKSPCGPEARLFVPIHAQNTHKPSG